MGSADRPQNDEFSRTQDLRRPYTKSTEPVINRGSLCVKCRNKLNYDTRSIAAS